MSNERASPRAGSDASSKSLRKKTHVPMPSLAMSLGMPSVRPLAKPGRVCTATFTASNGASAASAKNSALADATRNSGVWYLAAASAPAASA